MAQTHFFVSKGGKQEGPYSVDYIREKLSLNELRPTDHLYDSLKNEWVLMLEYSETAEYCKRPETSPRLDEHPEQQLTSEEEVWFILKGENKYGPFTYHDVIKMLQEKSLFEFDYVWKDGLSAWSRIAEVPDFKPENIQGLANSKEDKFSDMFFRRRHARASYGASLIIHNNMKLWHGESLELSAGGAGIVMDNVDLNPGETVFMHFKPGDGVPPFNAVCEIVSKQFAVENKVEKIRYGVKFTKINYVVQKAIKEFATKIAA